MRIRPVALIACFSLLAVLTGCGDEGHGDPPPGTPQSYKLQYGNPPTATFPPVCHPDVDCNP